MSRSSLNLNKGLPLFVSIFALSTLLCACETNRSVDRFARAQEPGNGDDTPSTVPESETLPPKPGTGTDDTGVEAGGDTTDIEKNPCALGPALEKAPRYSAPITIKKGGVYKGNWRSLDARVPAITIDTTEPVVIHHSQLQGRGTLIQVNRRAQLRICSVKGEGLNPARKGWAAGRFLNADSGEGFVSIEVSNSFLSQTRGIYILGPQVRGSLRIAQNLVSNIDGRLSDGGAGYLSSDNTNDDAQFVQLDQVVSIASAEIAWNQVVNEPNKSRSEDVINLYKTSGATASKPLLVHDNFIRGSYPIDPARTADFSGGGIMSGDGGGSGNISITNNSVVSTTNYGIAVAGGHDITVAGNRVVSSGLLSDGSRIAAQNVGIYAWNQYNDSSWSRITIIRNVVGWMGPSGRNDFWEGSPATFSRNSSLPNPIKLGTENNELALWQKKARSAGLRIGP